MLQASKLAQRPAPSAFTGDARTLSAAGYAAERQTMLRGARWMSRKPMAEIAASASHAELTSTSPDELLLAAWRAGVEGLRSRAHRAYLDARDRSAAAPDRADWVHVDGRWQATQQGALAACRAQAVVNVNSALHQAACVAEVRAILGGCEWFAAYQPPRAPKPPTTCGLVLAHHAAGAAGEHWLERKERLEREQALHDLTGDRTGAGQASGLDGRGWSQPAFVRIYGNEQLDTGGSCGAGAGADVAYGWHGRQRHDNFGCDAQRTYSKQYVCSADKQRNQYATCPNGIHASWCRECLLRYGTRRLHSTNRGK